MPLRRDFASRDELKSYLVEAFPDAANVDGRLSPFVGGRRAAEQRLAEIDPPRYARTRNGLDGAVTRLSPYIRHRVVSLAEVRDAVLTKVHKPYQATKLIQELAWHDYFQRVYAAVGSRGVWESLEPWKTGLGPGDYAVDLPADIPAAETGVDWVDDLARELHEVGYLHNHARLWLACYVVHARRVSWQAGARWFLQHLVDGDPASNNLSWQWVASTFGAKPYYTNREAIVKFSAGRFGKRNEGRGSDPLDAEYAAVQDRLFPTGPEATQDAGEGLGMDLRSSSPRPPDGWERRGDRAGSRVAWVHGDMLRPDHPALRGDVEGVYVFDDNLIRDAGSSLKPIGFVYECLLEMPRVTILRSDDFGGSVADAVRAFAASRGADQVVTGAGPSPFVEKIADELDAVVVGAEPFVELEGSIDLKRFSRYWKKAEKALKRSCHL